MPSPNPRPRDRWVQELAEDREARDLREQPGRRDLNHDRGMRVVVNDLGRRDLEQLGVKPRTALQIPVATSISGGFVAASLRRKSRRARGRRRSTG